MIHVLLGDLSSDELESEAMMGVSGLVRFIFNYEGVKNSTNTCPRSAPKCGSWIKIREVNVA